MGRFHTLDIRDRVVSMADGGQSRRAAARHFCISESAAIKLLRHRSMTGTVAPLQRLTISDVDTLQPHAPCIEFINDLDRPDVDSIGY